MQGESVKCNLGIWEGQSACVKLIRYQNTAQWFATLSWVASGAKLYLCDNLGVTSRNKAFTLQSNLTHMQACSGQRSILPDDVTLCCREKLKQIQLYLLSTLCRFAEAAVVTVLHAFPHSNEGEGLCFSRTLELLGLCLSQCISPTQLVFFSLLLTL